MYSIQFEFWSPQVHQHLCLHSTYHLSNKIYQLTPDLHWDQYLHLCILYRLLDSCDLYKQMSSSLCTCYPLYHYISCVRLLPSVLWRCWLGGRKGIRPVKNWVVGCWRGCLGWGADFHIGQQMPLPLTISCFSKSRLVLMFLVLPFGWSRTYSRRAVKRLCVCVCSCVRLLTTSTLYWIITNASTTDTAWPSNPNESKKEMKICAHANKLTDT